MVALSRRLPAITSPPKGYWQGRIEAAKFGTFDTRNTICAISHVESLHIIPLTGILRLRVSR